ncbi:MAG: class I SAM-dependent methyltransferase [Desulfurococcaceae archaeon]
MLNLPKILYKSSVKIAYKLGLYYTRMERYVEKFKDYITRDSTLLDLGCGRGGFSRVLVGRARRAISLNIDLDVLRILPSNPGILKVCADAQHLPVRPNSIDVVLAISLLEHVGDPSSVINEVYECLKPSGFFIVQLPNPQWFIEPHTKFPLLFILPSTLKEAIREWLKYDYVNFKLTLKSLENFLLETTYNYEENSALLWTQDSTLAASMADNASKDF